MALLLPMTMLLATGLAAAQPVVIADERFNAEVARAKATMLADPAAALRAAQSARVRAERNASGREQALMQATASWLEGEAYLRMSEADRAAPLIDATVRQATRIAPGSRLLADALLSRGTLRTESGDVAGAMNDFHAAHDLFRKLNEPRSQARSFAQIANLYYDAYDWTNALRYYGEALETFQADPGLAVAIHNGRGLALTELERFPEASREFNRAQAIARGMGSPLLSATVLNNAARTWLLQNQVDRADRAIKASIAETRDVATLGFRASQLAIVADVAFHRGELSRAARIIGQVFAGRDLNATTLVDRDAHETAYKIYRVTGDDDLALEHLAASKRLDKEATELARSNSAALMAARFDFANQELRIANLKAADLQKGIALERQRARTQRALLIGGVASALAIIALLAFALVVVRRSRDKVRAANVDLEHTNVALGRALAAKSEFLATTSHEIRTPLNGILGMTQVVLADAAVDARTRDRVGVVHAAGVTMRALVDDILDVAKMESGNLTVEMRPFDLKQTLHEAMRMWEDQARDKGLAFSADLADCPEWIQGDPGRLRQIVFNLLSNALKFTPEGSVRVEAMTAGNRYRIVVADTGVGIDPAQHEAIFESFRQADTTTTRRFGGTGLGLSICRTLSRAMGGDVGVASAEGQGATFTLDLPLIAAQQEASTDEIASGTRVNLVFDRNPIQRAKLKTVLASLDVPVIEAATLDELAERTHGYLVERALADDASLRAEGDLIEAMACLRAGLGETTRLVVLIAMGAEEIERSLLEAGASAVLRRPVAQGALLAVLNDDSTCTPRPIIVTQAA
ncbi:ATP-binding protein [Sphingomonas sp.]|uniref:ATP-binding protein n=1 Tax=Sphingomonas sp. TaxID=28214 RepID=UPI0035C7BE77